MGETHLRLKRKGINYVGKNKKKKGILGLEGQVYLDAYNKQMQETEKALLLKRLGL